MKKSLVTAIILAASLRSGFSQNVPLASAPPPPANASQTDSVKPELWRSIVRIDASFLLPDYRTPWNAGRPSGGSGTGWLVGKNKFLTNAHVVSNSTKLVIRLMDDPAPYEARILHIAHDCDLAMIEAVNPKPFEKLTPLQIDGIPQYLAIPQ